MDPLALEKPCWREWWHITSTQSSWRWYPALLWTSISVKVPVLFERCLVRWRQVFSPCIPVLIRVHLGYAREHEPCIIFMDEIDAIGGRRFSQGTSADREIQRTLMEVLSSLFSLLSSLFSLLSSLFSLLSSLCLCKLPPSCLIKWTDLMNLAKWKWSWLQIGQMYWTRLCLGLVDWIGK